MKLTKSKLIETLRKLNNGKTVYQARKIANVSVRRVYQVKEAYDRTGEIPKIGDKVGRPSKPFDNWEINLVKKSYLKYRVSADTLERLIDRDYQKHIGHNRINKIKKTMCHSTLKCGVCYRHLFLGCMKKLLWFFLHRKFL